MNATVIQFKRPFDPPRRQFPVVSPDMHSELIGLNQRQEGMAHKLSWTAGNRDKLMNALSRFFDVGREFDEAVEAYRAELLRALETKCPAAVKRIVEGNPPRRRPKRLTRSAIDDAAKPR
jgi:hypothetical protein